MKRINLSFDDITYCVLVNVAKQEGLLPGTYLRNLIKKTVPRFNEIILEKRFLQQNVFNSTQKKKGKK
jgi:hypothetical protein